MCLRRLCRRRWFAWPQALSTVHLDLVSSALAIILYCILIVALATGLLLLIDRIRKAMARRRRPPEMLAAERREFEERLLQPDWSFYQHHLQRPVPAALRELYADRTLVLSSFQYDDKHYLSTFEPLSEEGLVEAQEWLNCDVVPFANCDGDLIYLRPGKSEPDAVFITYHDGGETEKLAPDPATFLQRARLASQNA